MQRLASAYPNLAKMVVDIGKSHEGRTISALKVFTNSLMMQCVLRKLSLIASTNAIKDVEIQSCSLKFSSAQGFSLCIPCIAEGKTNDTWV